MTLISIVAGVAWAVLFSEVVMVQLSSELSSWGSGVGSEPTVKTLYMIGLLGSFLLFVGGLYFSNIDLLWRRDRVGYESLAQPNVGRISDGFLATGLGAAVLVFGVGMLALGTAAFDTDGAVNAYHIIFVGFLLVVVVVAVVTTGFRARASVVR